MIIKWFPRSWLQIKTEGCVIYTDPSYMSSFFKKYPKKVILSDAEDDALPEDLEAADLILISHTHTDHCKEITINRLSNKNTTILTPMIYKDSVDDRVKLVTPNNKYSFHKIELEVIDAYNTEYGASTRKFHKKGECVGYILNIEGKRIYFPGDTDLIPEMNNLGDIDLAFLPIGGTYTMDIDESIEAAEILRPKLIVPIHHLNADPKEYKCRLEEKTDLKVKLLEIGEELLM